MTRRVNNWDSHLENGFPTREELVTARLRNAILRGELKPGERLDQSDLAERLRVSRSPIRQALRVLAAEGLVKIYPHRAAIVAELSRQELEEIYFIRGMLEGMAARLAARAMDDKRILELGAIMGQLRETTDLDAWLDHNADFHHTIYEAANRPLMMSMIQNLRHIVAPYNRQYIATEEHRTNAQSWHERIYEACKARDDEAAEEATRQHLQAVYQGLLNHTNLELDK